MQLLAPFPPGNGLTTTQRLAAGLLAAEVGNSHHATPQQVGPETVKQVVLHATQRIVSGSRRGETRNTTHNIGSAEGNTTHNIGSAEATAPQRISL